MNILTRTFAAAIALTTVLGTVFAEEPKSGQAFGDWVFQCTAIAQDKTACIIQQTLMSQQTNKPIAMFSIQKSENTGESRLIALLPLGLDLHDGVKGKIDDGSEFDYQLDTCLPRGCVASVTLNAPLVDAMLAGKSFTTVLQMRGAKEPTSFAGSLKGVREGLKAIQVE